jgi:hypothetical protein
MSRDPTSDCPMSAPVVRELEAGARWRHPRNAARPVLLAAGLLLLLSGKLVAGQDGGEVTAGTDAPPAVTDETDPEAPVPLAFKPFVPKPLTSADLPPSNPLMAGGLPRSTSVAFSPDWRAGRNEYRAIIEREALAEDLPPAILDAVMAVESHYNPAVVGMDGEIGLMQVMPSTARMLGFSGTLQELALPDINIHYGARYLAGAWRRAGGDLCTATMKYRAGHGETRFSFLSVNYCMRVRSHLAAQGVAVAGSLPQPTFGSPASLGSSSAVSAGARPRARSPSVGATVNLAALNMRLRALTDRKVLRDPR